MVVSKLFERYHRKLVADLNSLKLVRVRTEGFNGYVILRFAGAIESRMLDMHLVHGAWKLQRPLDIPLP